MQYFSAHSVSIYSVETGIICDRLWVKGHIGASYDFRDLNVYTM